MLNRLIKRFSRKLVEARSTRLPARLRISCATAATVFLGTIQAAAAQDAGTVATNLAGNANAISNLAIAGAAVGGIITFIMGIKDLVTATTSKGRDANHVHGLVKMGAAALLFAIGIGLNTMKTTIFEGNSNSSIAPTQITVNP